MASVSTSGSAAPLPGAAAATPVSGLIAGATATPVPTAATPAATNAVTGGGATDATVGSSELERAQIAALTVVVNAVLALIQAHTGAGTVAPNASTTVTGGGSVTTAPIGGDVSVVTSSSLMGVSAVGGTNPTSVGWEIVNPGVVSTAVPTSGAVTGGGASSPNVAGGSSVGGGTLISGVTSVGGALGGTSVIGGGSIGTFGQQAVNTALGATGVVMGGGAATIGGSSSQNDWSIVDATVGTPIAAQPVATQPAVTGQPAVAAQPAAPAVAGGGATPIIEADAPVGTQVDMRRVSGTPAAGGVIQTILSRAAVSAMPAMSGGTWKVLADENGAQMQVHAHGRWANATNAQLLAGIQQGQVAVHLHADGTVHLHDPM